MKWFSVQLLVSPHNNKLDFVHINGNNSFQGTDKCEIVYIQKDISIQWWEHTKILAYQDRVHYESCNWKFEIINAHSEC